MTKRGWNGTYNGNHFRSFLELKYIKYLLDNNILFESGEQIKHRIFYQDNNKQRYYYPDFHLLETNQTIEIKPIYKLLDPLNLKKFEAAKNKLGLSFVVLNEKDIPDLSKDELTLLLKTKQVIFTKKGRKKFNIDKFYSNIEKFNKIKKKKEI